MVDLAFHKHFLQLPSRIVMMIIVFLLRYVDFRWGYQQMLKSHPVVKIHLEIQNFSIPLIPPTRPGSTIDAASSIVQPCSTPKSLRFGMPFTKG